MPRLRVGSLAVLVASVALLTTATPARGAFAADDQSSESASITIVRDAHDSQDFAFTTTGDGLGEFVLDDDNDPTLSNSRTFTDLAAGTYTVTEDAVAYWKLHDLSCSTPETIELATRTVTIALTAAEHVTCTFTNAANRPLAGAIRWDAWNDGPAGRAVEYTLGPEAWRDRLPWYASVLGPDSVEIRADNPGVADEEILHAADLGLDYFAFVWYDPRGPEGSEDETLSRGLRYYRASPNRDLVKYTVIIRPTNLADPVQNADVLDYLRDPNWVKVDGRPLIFVGMEEMESRHVVDELRASSVAQGTGNPYIVYLAQGPRSIDDGISYVDRHGFDAVSAYAISGGSSLGEPYAELTVETRKSWSSVANAGKAAVPTVMAGWDPRPRIERPPYWGASGTGWYSRATPEELGAHVGEAMEWSRAQASKATLIYAWNEYDEGGWIGPTLLGNDDDRSAVRQALVPRPTVTVTDPTVAERDGATEPMVFTVSLSAPTAETVTVAFTTADSSAVAPDDYTASSGTLTFAPGETTQTVSIEIPDDADPELDEMFRLLLQQAENATIARAEGRGTIINDDGPPVAPTDSYLSDLTPTSATNGYGPVERDTSNGGAAAGDGNPLTFNGATFAKGLGVHAASTVTYPLAGVYETFVADVGVDDSCGSAGTVVFQVLVDGVKRFDSGAMNAKSPTKPVSVNVSDGSQLTLKVTNAGDGGACDHADWANAQVTIPRGTPPTSTTTSTTLPPAGEAFLSDLAPSWSANGYGPVERDTSNGGAAAGDGNPIRLNGATFAKGLGVHSVSTLTYSLNGAHRTFVADIGVDDECGTAGTVVFQVLVNGVKRFDSGTMNARSATKPVSVNVSDGSQLTLKVTNAGDGSSCDHADWANARLS